MKIAITASTPELTGPVDPRFGRSPHLIFIDPESMEFEAIENPNISATSGAGIQSAQLVVKKGVKALLTGSCGPNAYQTLQAGGVEVFVGVSGTVKEAVDQYKQGRLQSAAQPNVSAHSGIGKPGAPTGQDAGSGMGRGMGRGRGMGPGMGQGFPPSAWQNPTLSPEEELEALKQQAEFLRQNMEQISKRIEELEKKS
jgi:predicted Fe-Mo cluster-binding NifX family protein